MTLLWAAVLFVPDVVSHVSYVRQARLPEIASYALSLAASWALFVGLVSGFLRLRRKRPLVSFAASALLGVWMGIAIAFAVPYRFRYGQDFPTSYLAFSLKSPRYAWKLFRGETGASLRALMVALFAGPALAVVLFVRSRRAPLVAKATARKLGVIGLAATALFVTNKRASLPADLHEARIAFATVTLLSVPGQLPAPKRPRLPPLAAQPAASRPNVLLVIGESLAAAEWAPWSGNANDPGLATLFEAARGAFVPLLDAKCGAGATDLSVPMILTGLRSDASPDAFSRAPLVWHEARARGYATGFFSPQDYDWLRVGTFILGPDPPDVVRTMRDFPGAPKVNDGAVDDMLAIDAAIRFIDDASARAGKPFFAVVQLNATHFPAWAPGLESASSKMDEARVANKGRRPLALAYVERLQRKLLDHVAEAGLLDDTLIVATSDHGTTLRPETPARLESHYEDVMHVPMFVHLPRGLREQRPGADAALRANARERTCNADIFPTLLDAWSDASHEPGGRPALAGASLLRPLPDRTVLAMSTGPVRRWHRRGFALYHGRWKWLVDELDGVRVFDLVADRAELDNALARVPAAERARFIGEVRSSKPLTMIVEDVAPELLKR